MPEGGYPARALLPGGTPLILTPTVCPNVISSKGRVTDAEIARTRELLRDGQGPAIVAGHYPVLHATRGYASSASRRLRNADALRETLGRFGTPARVCVRARAPVQLHRRQPVRQCDASVYRGVFFEAPIDGPARRVQRDTPDRRRLARVSSLLHGRTVAAGRRADVSL